MFEINKEEFGAFNSQLRKEKGLMQKDIAEKLFVSDKAVSKWERGVCKRQEKSRPVLEKN